MRMHVLYTNITKYFGTFGVDTCTVTKLNIWPNNTKPK